MAGQLIPPPELDPPVRSGSAPQHRMAQWIEVTDAAEVFFLAGLRRRAKSDADLRELYRQSYAEQMRDHDEGMRQLMRRVHERSQPRAR